MQAAGGKIAREPGGDAQALPVGADAELTGQNLVEWIDTFFQHEADSALLIGLRILRRSSPGRQPDDFAAIQLFWNRPDKLDLIFSLRLCANLYPPGTIKWLPLHQDNLCLSLGGVLPDQMKQLQSRTQHKLIRRQ